MFIAVYCRVYGIVYLEECLARECVVVRIRVARKRCQQLLDRLLLPLIHVLCPLTLCMGMCTDACMHMCVHMRMNMCMDKYSAWHHVSSEGAVVEGFSE